MKQTEPQYFNVNVKPADGLSVKQRAAHARCDGVPRAPKRQRTPEQRRAEYRRGKELFAERLAARLTRLAQRRDAQAKAAASVRSQPRGYHGQWTALTSSVTSAENPMNNVNYTPRG